MPLPMLVPVLLLVSLPAAAERLAGWSTVETAHFRIHLPPKPAVSPTSFPTEMERAYAELHAVFGAELPGKIDYYVWNTNADAEKLLGRPLGFARPDLLLVHAAADQTRGHELTHVLVHHAVHPDRSTRFIEEGTAAAFDLTGRDRVALARQTIERAAARGPFVVRLWTEGDAQREGLLYPVAGAFVEQLFKSGGRERFLRFLKTQTIEHARNVYGADFDTIVADFEARIGSPSTSGPSTSGASGTSAAQGPAPSPPSAPSVPTSQAAGTGPSTEPTLEELRGRAQERMREDRKLYTVPQLQEIESLYMELGRNPRAPDAKERLKPLLERYPKANRTGCAVLYIARASGGAEREEYLKRAIADHSDAWYGDGTQVGAFARMQLAVHYANTDRRSEGEALAAEVQKSFPGAVDHSGTRLVDLLKRFKLLP